MRRRRRWRLGRLRRQQRRRLGRLRRQQRQRPGRLRRHLGLSSGRVATGMASTRCLHGGIGRAGSAGGTTNIGRAGSAGQAPPAFSRCPHRGITSTGCGRAGGCGCVGADSCCFPRFSGRPVINASWTLLQSGINTRAQRRSAHCHLGAAFLPLRWGSFHAQRTQHKRLPRSHGKFISHQKL